LLKAQLWGCRWSWRGLKRFSKSMRKN